MYFSYGDDDYLDLIMKKLLKGQKTHLNSYFATELLISTIPNLDILFAYFLILLIKYFLITLASLKGNPYPGFET